MLTLTGPIQLRLPWNGAISSPVSMSGHREKQNWPPGLPRCVTAPYLQLLIREWKLDMFPGVFDRVQKSVLLYCCCLWLTPFILENDYGQTHPHGFPDTA